jgi:glucose-1-phosphate adenylyltransferase
VQDSVLFPQVSVAPGAVVEGAVLFSGCQVGPGARIHRAILDKGVRVGEGARVVGAERLLVLPKRSEVGAGIDAAAPGAVLVRGSER